MDDLISRKALIKRLETSHTYHARNSREEVLLYRDIRIINEQPSVDAVEVVRCKDCKHWKHFPHLGCTDFVKVCGLANYMIGANGYCLYGERETDG